MEKEVFDELFGTEQGESAKESAEAEKEAVTMSKVNWKQKLSSRKLWAAVAAAVLAVIAAVFGGDLSAETVDMIKTGIYSLVAYVFGEGAVDFARIIGQAKVDAASAVPINFNFGKEDDAE
jgi:hypothetical protein